MERLLLKATVTATDEGMFEAVISTATVDRERDVVDPNAMVEALHKWTQTGKLIPLAWNHSTAPEDQIGHIDPVSARNVNGEVVVKGWIDQSTEVGGHAWRLVKSGTLGFSFGYLILKSTNRQGGGRDIKELDVFEVTATTTPMNGDTRVVSFKALIEDGVFDESEMQAALEGELKAVWTAAYINDLPDSAFLYVESGDKDSDGKTTPRSKRHFPVKDASGNVDLPHLRNALARIPQSNLPQSVKDAATAKAQRMLDAQKSVDVTDPEPTAPSVDPLRKHARDTAKEVLRGGVDVQPPTQAPEEPKPQPEMDPAALRKYSRDLIVSVLSGREPSE